MAFSLCFKIVTTKQIMKFVTLFVFVTKLTLSVVEGYIFPTACLNRKSVITCSELYERQILFTIKFYQILFEIKVLFKTIKNSTF